MAGEVGEITLKDRKVRDIGVPTCPCMLIVFQVRGSQFVLKLVLFKMVHFKL